MVGDKVRCKLCKQEFSHKHHGGTDTLTRYINKHYSPKAIDLTKQTQIGSCSGTMTTLKIGG